VVANFFVLRFFFGAVFLAVIFFEVALPVRRPAVSFITDHAVLHTFLIALGQIREDRRSNGLQRLTPICGQFSEILFDGRGFALHRVILPRRYLKRRIGRSAF